MAEFGAREIDEDGYEVIRNRPIPKGIKCGECGMKFDHGVAYGYWCPSQTCPVQPKAT